MSNVSETEKPRWDSKALVDWAIAVLKACYYSLRIADFFDLFN